ncbi:GNAT family N-acetyltransferase [Candidatus Marinamargulisbacteria bacterium SCGC AG-414-C22]|nr:GNAT family N-acetyltransferase [Candidatus Marinamargulisbacteria bacterium SCGC AG-414-C22]
MTNIKIIDATTINLEQIVPLFDQYRLFYDQESNLKSAHAFIKTRLEQQDSIIILAIEDGQAKGFAQVYPSFSSVSMQALWILNDLYVQHNARRKGIGKHLIKHLQKQAKTHNVQRLILRTGKANQNAQSLYTQLGFQVDQAFLTYQFEIAGPQLSRDLS